MASQVRSTTTWVSSGGGSVVWGTPTNAQTSNNAYAQAILGAGNSSQYLQGTVFGFSIPVGATIDGVSVRVERNRGIHSTDPEGIVSDLTVRLIKGGTIQGNNKSVGTNFPDADAYRTYGGAADLWGLTLAVADVNATNFGIAFQCWETGGGSARGRVDHIEMTVYYTEAANPRERAKMGVGL